MSCACGGPEKLYRLGAGPRSAAARRNLAFNRLIELSGPVNGQGLPPVRDMRYGAVDMARSGCGVIAVYNALVLLGEPYCLCDVIAWGDRHAAVLFGLLGTFPSAAKGLFRRLGCEVAAVRDPRAMDACARKADVCLFTYWNRRGSVRRGMHTVCARWRDGGLEVYNLSNACAGTARKGSFLEWTAEGIGPVVLYCVRGPKREKGSP